MKGMSYFKKALKIVVNFLSIVLLFVLALAVYGKATTIFGKNSYPSYFGYTFFSVASGSMEPTLHINDVILVKLGNNNIAENDIITYTKNNEIITHRVIHIERNVLSVKGDNNNTMDVPITTDQVIGKTVKIFPKLSIWQKVITEPKILVAIFVTLLLFDFAISYKGKEEKKPDTKEEAEPVKINKIEAENQDKLKDKELLELTKSIDVEEVKKLIDDSKKEEKIKKEEEVKEVKEVIEEKQDEEDKDNYTVRLDLSEIQRKIRNKIK